MSKRFKTSVNDDEKVLRPGHFVAKFGGVCHVCGLSYEKGEICHYVDSKSAHEYCHNTGGTGERYGNWASGEDDPEPREPSYVVKGRRKPKLCGSCFLEHNGECP